MKKLIALFALLLAALALAACGSDSATDAATDAAGAVEEAGETAGEKAEEAGEAAEEGAEEAQNEAEGGSAGSSKAVDVEADPSGQLAFTSDEASAKAGKVTVNFTNTSPVPHDVRIESSGGEELGGTEVLAEGSESATVDLKPGEYTFFCSVPGHRQAGMEGTLKVE